MDLRVEIGQKIKDLRQRRRVTLKQIEARAGISATHISEIERGKTSPTVGALEKIARALEIDAALFLGGGELPPCTVVRADERRRCVLPREGRSVESLTGAVARPALSVFFVDFAPGQEEDLHGPHEGEEMGLVIQGELKVEWDGHSRLVAQGESIHFPAGRPHRVYNPTAEPARALWATVPRSGY